MIQALIIVTLIALVFYRYVYKPRVYWNARKYPSVPGMPLFGNFFAPTFGLTSFYDTYVNLYRSSNAKLMGVHFLTTPMLIVKDLQLIRTITIKHFDQFVNHSKLFLNLESEPALDKNLFNIEDDDWRRMRATLSPAFTGSKMRMMFPLMQECSNDLGTYFTKLIKSSTSDTAEFHAKDACSHFTNDVIATTAFGIRVNSLDEHDHSFYVMAKRALKLVFWRIALVNFVSSRVLKWFNFNLLDKEATDYLITVFKRTLNARRDSGIVRHDMVHLLLEAQKVSVEEAKTDANLKALTDEDLTAQAFLFLFGGYDTVATQLCFTLLELAMNPDVQQKLYEEINAVDGQLTYEKIMSLKYLDWTVQENQRKWSQAVVLDRVCTKDLEFELDGEKRVIRKGDVVGMPINGLHHDPRLYKDPNVFDPERFSEENVKSRHPCAYIPFGSGPRFCIGNRYAMLTMKVMLANCVKAFEFVPTDNTEMPIALATNIALVNPNNDTIGVRARV